MTSDVVETFIETVKKNSTYSKCLQRDVIDKLISKFDISCEKIKYPQKINNCMKLALQFYKEYNYEYYNIIINELKNKNIVINNKTKTSCVDTVNNTAYIKLLGNDSDLFMIVHELAHFIDIKYEPQITPVEYNFLCEVFSFYMERQLENYLLKQEEKYDELIATRKNNRIFFENKFMNDIKKQLYYEDLYKNQGIINEEQIDIEDAKRILKYNVSNIVNFLLRYPLGNILSEYIINNNLLKQDYDICQVCFQLDLRIVLDDYILTKTKTRTLK